MNLVFIKQTTFKCKHPKGIYKCFCGKEKEISISHVKSGHTKSCGCISSRNTIGERGKKHGFAGKNAHPLYNVWCSMKARCYDKNSTKYHVYGAVGVRICDEWINDFMAFYSWAINNGWKKGLQIDKDIKGNGFLYSPENCLVVTSKQNNNCRTNNHIIEYNGEKKTAPQWSILLGIRASTILSRINNYNWSIEKALTTPLMKNQYV